MKKQRVRPLALCLLWREDAILVAEGYDNQKRQFYYRPLGGKIEFGELGAQTVVREFREEIDETIVVDRFLGVLENLFVDERQSGHEIVLVYEGHFANEVVYQREPIEGRDAGELLFRAYWKPLAFFKTPDAPPLYPDGLMALIEKSDAGRV